MAVHWSERFESARRKKGWSYAELGRRSGVSVDLIYKYARGTVDTPRGGTLAQLSAALEVSELWLVYGKDVGTTNESQIGGLRMIPMINLSELSDLKRPADLPKITREREVMAVPEEVGPRAVVVRLDDHSMEPRFEEGARIVCDPDAPIVPGKYVIAVSHIAKRAVMRRYRQIAADSGRGELLAENPDFPPLKMATDKDGFIVGRATFIFHRL